MRRCRSHGELLGPYVLGALEAAEAEELRRHLAECSSCAAEERALGPLPELLDLVEADAPTPEPPPELEDAVLDRFVRERSRAKRPAPGWLALPPLSRRLAIPAIAVAAVLLALAIAVLPGGGDAPAYARAELRSTAGSAWAVAELEEVDAGTRVKLRAEGLPKRRTFELWCVTPDGRWVSGGTFRGRPDGTAAAELTAAVRPGDYHLMVVTRRSAGGRRGAEVMRGELEY